MNHFVIIMNHECSCMQVYIYIDIRCYFIFLSLPSLVFSFQFFTRMLALRGALMVMMCQYRSTGTFSVSTQPIFFSMIFSMILYMTFWGHLEDILGTSSGHLRDIFGTSSGHLRNIFGTSSGHLVYILGISWEYLGDFLRISWVCLGDFLGISWFPFVGVYLQSFSSHFQMRQHLLDLYCAQITSESIRILR